MLGGTKLVAFISTRDLALAKPFYREVLGLRLLSEDSFALVFDAYGIMLRVTKVSELTPQRFTVLGWGVPDIAPAVADLEARGAQFERYAGMDQDEHAIWTAPSGAKVAWFKDPDGNVLSVSQLT
ncbi:MAG TPA: VOC family protein [Terriglobia bacterium]|nr:VOC family protein [Terriglobia bacterium]